LPGAGAKSTDGMSLALPGPLRPIPMHRLDEMLDQIAPSDEIDQRAVVSVALIVPIDSGAMARPAVAS
jgi:hypothetical protein